MRDLKNFLKSGDVIAFVLLTVIIAVVIVVFGTVEYTPIPSSCNLIENLPVSSGVEIINL